MPLYEYRCEQCGRLTEKIQKFSDPELTICPHCGGSLARTLSAPAVHFSGGGWYKDLYSSAKPPAATGGDGASAASGGDQKGGSNAGDSGGGSAATPATAPAPASAPAAAGSTPSAPATSKQ